MTFSYILKDLETICYLKLVQCVIAVKFPRLSAGSRRNVLTVFWKLSLFATSSIDGGNPCHIWITWLLDFARCLIQSLIENSFFSWTDRSMFLPHFDVTVGAVSISEIFSLFNNGMMD